MKRKKIITHRNPEGKDIRKYGENYIDYFYIPHKASIRENKILIEPLDKSINKIELVNIDTVLSNFLNLGKKLYDYIHEDLYKSNYLYDRKMFSGLVANNIFEFIELETWKYDNIQDDVVEWINANPFYGEYKIVDDELYALPINYTNFVSISIITYMLFRLYNISYTKCFYNNKTKQYCLLSVFSDIIKKDTSSKNLYLDKLKNLNADDINKYCIIIMKKIISIYPIRFSSYILDDGNYIKVYDSLLSMAIESLYSYISFRSNSIKECSNCGNFYAGHGNSTLCIPCREWKDNHKHIKKR